MPNFMTDLNSTRNAATTASLIQAGLAVAVLYGIYRILQVGKRDKRMPPGPPTLPVLGNLHQIPQTGLYKRYLP